MTAPVSAVLSSASAHDSQVAVPLSRLSEQQVTSLYDVMDAAVCSDEWREDSRALGHVPLIDHNPRSPAAFTPTATHPATVKCSEPTPLLRPDS